MPTSRNLAVGFQCAVVCGLLGGLILTAWEPIVVTLGAAATVLLTVWDTATDADEFEASLVPALGPEFAGAVDRAEDRADAPAPLVRAGRAVALVRGDVARLGLDRTALRAHLVTLDRSLGEE